MTSEERIDLIRYGILTPRMLEAAVAQGAPAVRELARKQGISREEMLDCKSAWGIYAAVKPKP